MLYYATACLVIDFLVCIYSVRRTGLISPLSFYCIFGFICLFYYYFVGILGVLPNDSFSVMPLYNLGDFGYEVNTFYVALNLSAIPFIASVPRSKQVNLEAFKTFLDLILTTRAMLAFFILLSILILFHAREFDFGYFWSYQGYHAIDDLQAVGISNPLAAFYHRTGPTLSAISGCLAVVAFHTSRRGLGIALTALALYGLALALASSSREGAVIVGLATLVHFMLRKKLDLLIIAGGLVSLGFITFALAARSRYGMQGIGHIFDNLGEISFQSLPQLVASLTSNIAQGATGLANAMRFSPTYPESFIVTSLYSVMPGDLDNYAKIAADYQVKITHANPMSALAEAYYFGFFHLVFFVALVLFIMRSSTIMMSQRFSFMTLPVYGVSILLIYRMHHYTMRISNRLIILFFAFLVIDFFIRHRGVILGRRPVLKS